MIRLGLRLALGGGREAIIRLVLIAAGVALGVGLLLFALAGLNAVSAQNDRYAWLETGVGTSAGTDSAGGVGMAGRIGVAVGAPAGSATDPLWWRLSSDRFDGHVIGRVDLAATGPHAPLPPGISRLPGPGQFYASPAMSTLLRSTPGDQLGARYPARQVGLIGADALPSPDSLIIVIGRQVGDLAQAPGAELVTRISTTSPSGCQGDCVDIGINANGIALILSVVTAALLFPITIFIGTATRLSAARREQRFASMRLVGATPRQISVISAVESGVAAVAGTAAGFALFPLARPAVAGINLTGDRFFSADLSLGAMDIALTAVGVPTVAVLAAWLTLRRVIISPLGVTRRVTPPAPRAWRALPLLAGLGELAWFVHAGRPASTGGQVEAYLTGILLTMVGLVVVGPWLTSVTARLLAARTSRPGVLIGARRLADNPRAGFRAISGLVLALFVTSVAVGIITTINAYGSGGRGRPLAHRGPDQRGTLIDRYTTFTPDGPRDVASIPASLPAQLRAIHGVRGVTVIHTISPDSSDHPAIGAVSCAELATTPALGRCPAGTPTVTIGDAGWSPGTAHDRQWPAAPVSAARLARLPVQSLAVTTDGPAALERARTALRRANPQHTIPITIAEEVDRDQQRNASYQRLAEIVALVSLPIAGCGLAVSAVAGLAERGRPFSLLRLAGAPMGLLRRVVLFENAVPLVVLALVSVVTGFLTAGLFLHSQLDETLQPPPADYWLLVAAGLVASLTVVASTLTLLNRATGPALARNG
ncbi:ABC transporter permease [Frankia canadensis]|uniref:ABC transporter permease n=1 Tax=Frankia canadensis TaxID=1836972 RepID=A0A2I2L1D4_9ACTN|nr:FtsX-like permease family protein [Frankia canadensis]SNQ51732.1 ABC transporter permease [Frankia canadensis]SOU59022.1 ABC transporter permease [Frankia canadensis]